MKKITVTKYECDFCGKVFDKEWQCDLHEREEHMCPVCVHGYYVYGCELHCELTDVGKKCHFKEKNQI